MEGDQAQEQQGEGTWFTKFQLQSMLSNGVVPDWFHGIISRQVAEKLLMAKPPGYFLIRVSETRIGYTLSYRAEDRCRHFMINVGKDGLYTIVGETVPHQSLQDMVDFHQRSPIMPFCEMLTVPCVQSSKDKIDYAELLFTPKHLCGNIKLQPQSFVTPSTSRPQSPDVVPPALPYRPNNMANSAASAPNVTKTSAEMNRLYPFLENEFENAPSLPPQQPVPLPRKKYLTPAATPFQPPDVPARDSVPPLNQNQVCTRLVSVLESPSMSPVIRRHFTQSPGLKPERPQSVIGPFVKNQAVVTNFKNLKKRFQKKRSTSQEHTYAEIGIEAGQSGSWSGNCENEYQGVKGMEGIDADPFSCTGAAGRLTDGRLPHEYLSPPPFAPGY